VFEKNKIKKIKKYKPPSHCDKDLQISNVGSKYFTFLKIVKPVPVSPEKDSNRELISVI
tara:strand:+ start:308 stop:484 length:177 start_codon:yes stop_codon:yes gene_type:complete